MFIKGAVFYFAATTLVFPAIADETLNDQQSKKYSGETIVILGKIPRPISDVFGAASVINRETMDNELAHDIADLARYQAGINIESNGTRFGASGFNIRGIGGNRVATEIDGIPVADQFDVGSYSNSGRNFIDLDLIQQVEILRGPSSSVYGSNAIGGVVSFISKKPSDLLSKTKNDYYVGLKTGYYGVDNSILLSAHSAFSFGQSSALLSVSRTTGHEFDNHASKDTLVDPQDKTVESILGKYFYDFSNDQQLSVSIDYFNKNSDTTINSLLGLGRFRSTTALSGDDEYKRKNIALAYEFNSNSAWAEGGVVRWYHQKSDTKQLTDENRTSRGKNYLYNRDFYYQQDIDGLRVNLFTNLLTDQFSHSIGYGLEWSKRKVTELRNALQTNLATNISTNIVLSEQFPVRDFPISNIKDVGFYINDEITIEGTNFSVIPALRFDQYKLDPAIDQIYSEDNPSTEVVNVKNSRWSPKLGIQQKISANSKWFAQYFEGFRSPPFEDANIGLDIPLFNLRAIPNPDLKSEKSKGYEVGYRYKSPQHHLDIIGFYTDYEDFIQTKVNLGFDPVLGRIIFQSQNIDNAKIYGGEIQYSYSSNGWLTSNDSMKIHASFFWSKGENEESKQPLNDIDPNHLLLGINWLNSSQKWSVTLNASLYAAKNDIEPLEDPTEILYKTSGYGILDIMTSYQLADNITIFAGIYNLTNHQYWRWSDVNGLTVDDPLIDTLSASGINSSVQLKINW